MDRQIDWLGNDDIDYSNSYAAGLAKLALVFYDEKEFAGENVNPEETAQFLMLVARRITYLERRLNSDLENRLAK